MPATLTSFKVLTFDVVGTLIDFEAGLTAGLAAIAAEHGVDFDAEAALAIYGEARRDAEAGKFPDDVARCYGKIAAHFALPVSPELGARMVEAVAAAPAFPDSVASLASLKKRYRLVAMTNAQRWAFERFSSALGDPFWKSYTTDDTGAEKPDPAFFEHVFADLAKEGIAQDDILHVAQSQYHDIGISRQLGLTNCWIERRHGRAGYGGTIAPERFTKPDFHFTTLAALAEEVDGL
ncbi:HAD-IA family hydrolase [Jiella sp. MQZ9-1]|uniref:HAD-IA family hydrolase n=1 Tax=Jiella flava TaxID=2816857 RepID=UPI001E45AC9A|nr:HAD-IA family hydrolase [Jiella flava]MCD2472925.1 HAD-IA family hydrolase [Jiella flava]